MENFCCSIPCSTEETSGVYVPVENGVRAIECKTGMVFGIQDYAMIDCVTQLSTKFQLEIRPSKLDNMFVVGIGDKNENTKPVWKRKNEKLSMEKDIIWSNSKY